VPIVALASSAAALIGVGWLMRLIFAAQRRIPIVSDTAALGDLGSLSKEERRIRDALFRSVADEQKVANLRAAELRARELERQAEGEKDPATKAALKEKVARLDAAVERALSEAALLIVEHRSGNVFRGIQPILAFTLAALGIIIAFGVADYSKGQRDLIALRKSCAEALAAGAQDPCKSVVDFQPGPTGPTGPTGQSGSTVNAIMIGVAPRSARGCTVAVRVNGKRTNATDAGMAKLTINDRSRNCGVRLRGGGLTVASGWLHTGSTTAEVVLRPISYTLTTLRGRQGSTPTVREVRVDPLVATP
jgi:hypothetical protein